MNERTISEQHLISMLVVFIRPVLCQVTRVTFRSFQPGNTVLDFGFKAGGTFAFHMEAPYPSEFRGLLMSSNEMTRADKPPFSDFCSAAKPHLALHNISQASKAFTWSGSVSENGTHTLYFWDCNSRHTIFILTAVLANPRTLLDVRDIVLPKLYGSFAFSYFVIAIIWVVNAFFFMDFRIRLHTVFLCVPAIRGMSLWLMRSMWARAAITDDSFDQSIEILVLNFMFYTLTLASISWASTGFWIYRETFDHSLFLRGFWCSAGVTASILSVPFLSEFRYCFVLFGIIWFSVLGYLRDIILAIVLSADVVKVFRNDRLVTAKFSLSRRFVMSSSFAVSATVCSVLFAGIWNTRNWIRVVIHETGLLINAILQARCFLLRGEYSGTAKHVPRAKRSLKTVAHLITPVHTQLVLLKSSDSHSKNNDFISVRTQMTAISSREVNRKFTSEM
jgi:hypothetical protein